MEVFSSFDSEAIVNYRSTKSVFVVKFLSFPDLDQVFNFCNKRWLQFDAILIHCIRMMCLTTSLIKFLVAQNIIRCFVCGYVHIQKYQIN